MSARSQSFRFFFSLGLALWTMCVGGVREIEAQTAQPPQPAQSQPVAGVIEAALRAEEVARVRKQREDTAVVYPYGLSGTTSNGAALLAGTENKRVSITATIPTSLLSAFSIQASAPLSESDPRSSVLQLDGLANKGKVGAEWRYGQQRLPTRDELTALTKDLAELCLKKPEFSSNNPTETGLIVQACSLATLQGDAQLGSEARRLIQRYFPRRAAWFLSFKGDVGAESFKYLDPVTFAENEPRKWSPSGSVILGYLTPQNVYLSAAVRFEKTHKAADKQATCTISDVGVRTACPILTVGGPKEETPKITEGEIRRYVPVGDHNLGLSGIIRRDWDGKETSIEVPIFFVKDKDGGLSGGVSVGYLWSPKPDNQGPRFAVFVGQAFGLNNGS